MTLWCCRSSLCGLFRIYCFVPLNFTLSGTICSSVKLKSSGNSWNSLHETKHTKAWSFIYCSHNAAEQQCSKTCFCSCLQQMHIDFVFHKFLTSPVIKNSPMTCSSSFFETSSKFQFSVKYMHQGSQERVQTSVLTNCWKYFNSVATLSHVIHTNAVWTACAQHQDGSLTRLLQCSDSSLCVLHHSCPLIAKIHITTTTTVFSSRKATNLSIIPFFKSSEHIEIKIPSAWQRVAWKRTQLKTKERNA